MTTPSDPSPLARLTAAFAMHDLWFQTGGYQGARIRLAEHAKAWMDTPAKPRIEHVQLHGADMTDADISGWRFEHSTFDGASVTGLKANGATFVACNLLLFEGDRVTFDRAHFKSCTMDDWKIERLSLKHAQLRNVSMSNVETQRLDADHVHIDGITGLRIDGSLRVYKSGAMRNAVIRDANLGLWVNDLDMSAVHVSDSPRFTASVNGGSVEGGRFMRVRLRSSEWKGVSACGLRIEACDLQFNRMENSDLDFATIDGSSLDHAVLRGNSLRGATVRESSGDRMALHGNDLSGADLTGLSGRLGSYRENATSMTTRLSRSMERFDRTSIAAKRLHEEQLAMGFPSTAGVRLHPAPTQSRRGEER